MLVPKLCSTQQLVFMTSELMSYFCCWFGFLCVLTDLYSNNASKKEAINHYTGGREKVGGDPKDCDDQKDISS